METLVDRWSGYGVLIKEPRLLARSAFVVDGSDRARYVEAARPVFFGVRFRKL